MLNPTLIKKLNNNLDFQIFKRWLVQQIITLDSVDDLEEMSNEKAGEEAKIRSKTKATINKILAEFILPEPKEPSIERLQKAKNKGGL